MSENVYLFFKILCIKHKMPTYKYTGKSTGFVKIYKRSI